MLQIEIAITKHQLANNILFHKMWQAYHNACELLLNTGLGVLKQNE